MIYSIFFGSFACIGIVAVLFGNTGHLGMIVLPSITLCIVSYFNNKRDIKQKTE